MRDDGSLANPQKEMGFARCSGYRQISKKLLKAMVPGSGNVSFSLCLVLD
jgi:hypothetical protein